MPTEHDIDRVAQRLRQARNTKCKEREFPCDVCDIPKFDGCRWLARIALTEAAEPWPTGLEGALA